jgi:hypothetical protein
MGTWDSGPFNNDAALDYVGDAVDSLAETIESFVESPQIDDGFDEAFAALAVLNRVMSATQVQPTARLDDPAYGQRIRAAFINCFDNQIDDMDPDPVFKAEHRSSLILELDTFEKLLRAPQH